MPRAPPLTAGTGRATTPSRCRPRSRVRGSRGPTHAASTPAPSPGDDRDWLRRSARARPRVPDRSAGASRGSPTAYNTRVPSDSISLDHLAADIVNRSGLRFTLATDDATREIAYRLRYQALVDQRWQVGSDYPDGREQDGYDVR